MDRLLLDALVAGILAAWLGLSVINQFKFPWFDRFLQYDHFTLIPHWTFFAPNPGQTDYHLVYRDKLPDGSITPWREAELAQPRNLAACLWNPHKRANKILSDVAMSIAQVVRTNQYAEQNIVISIQYLLLLNHLTRCLQVTPESQRQFAVVETKGYFRDGPPRVVLRSDFHSADRELTTHHDAQVSA